MITRAEIQAAVRIVEGHKAAPPPELNEFKEPIDPKEVTRRWVAEVCKFFMEDIPIPHIAQHSNCDEALVERMLDKHLGGYLESLEESDTHHKGDDV